MMIKDFIGDYSIRALRSAVSADEKQLLNLFEEKYLSNFLDKVATFNANDTDFSRVWDLATQNKRPTEIKSTALQIIRSIDPTTREFLDLYFAFNIGKKHGIFSDIDVQEKFVGCATFNRFLKSASQNALLLCAIGAIFSCPLLCVWAMDIFINSGKSLIPFFTVEKIRTWLLSRCPTVHNVSPGKIPSFIIDANYNQCKSYEAFVEAKTNLDGFYDIDGDNYFDALTSEVMNYNQQKQNTSAIEQATYETTVKASTMTHINLKDEQKNIISAVLSTSPNLPSIDEIIELANSSHDKDVVLAQKESEISRLKQEIQTVMETSVANASVDVKASGDIPSGKSVMVDSDAVFPELKGIVNFKVPAYEWDAPHPHVPKVDSRYIFRPEVLLPFLMGFTNNENIWLSGHTGSGKTTLVEQICARLNYPLVRVAFDHAIDRYELMGSTTLISDGNGGTKSQFNPGILEQTIPNGYVLLCDELDCARPDNLYVMQDILEHKTKFVLESNDEDGQKSREIKFNPLSRIVATGNTKGNGDEFNLYPACRTLSAATLDRFTTWVEVDYLTETEESKLLSNNIIGCVLDDKQISSISQFAKCMRDRFINGAISVSFSPRRSIQLAKKINFLVSNNKKISFENAARIALQTVVLNCTNKDSLDEIMSLSQVSFGVNQSTGYKELVAKLAKSK